MKKESAVPGVMGMAPALLVRVVPWCVLAVLASIFVPGLGRFQGMFRGVWFSFALWYAACGLVFYADLVVRLLRALKTGTLASRGTYGLCRHPLYAWWIFFVFPVAGIFLDNWFFLFPSVAGAVAVRRHVWVEDRYLKERFGEAYRDYRERVRELLPVPRIRPVTGRRFGKLVCFLVILAVASLAFLVLVIRPVILRFGATNAEVAASLPGDDLVPRPRQGYTQAITIDAPPEAVWPWLIQVGYRRAGWYNIDAINSLAGKDYFIDGGHSSNRIVPELQGLKAGGKIYLAAPMGFDVLGLEKERTLLIGAGTGTAGRVSEAAGTPAPGAGNTGATAPAASKPAQGFVPMKASWVFALSPLPDSRTRLVTRFRSDFPGGAGIFVLNDIVNFLGGAMLQQQAMFVGLSRRAERLWKENRDRVVDIDGD